jgi:hypothetical protein
MFIAPDIKYSLSFIQCAFQIYKHVAPPALSLDSAGLNKMPS